MTITHEHFRRAEAMMLAASVPGTEALMSVIALALETMAPPPHPDDVAVSEPITVCVAALAERLDWSAASVVTSLVHASEELREAIGCRLFAHHPAENEEASAYTGTSTPTKVRLSDQLTSVLRGKALRPVPSGDPRAFTPDNVSAAMLDFVECCAETGGALLVREAEVADERDVELSVIAATVANHPALAGKVFWAGPSEDRVSPATALLAAVLHGAGILVIADSLFDPQPSPGVEDDSDEIEQVSRRSVVLWQPTVEGAKALTLLPYVPIAVLVPVVRDIILTPRAASAFVTAIGPLRRDRRSATESLQALAGGRLDEAVAERLVDFWDGRSELARVSLAAVGRMIDGPTNLASRRRRKRFVTRDDDASVVALAFSTAADAMVSGIAPHVWAPTKRQEKAQPIRFLRELFVCEPDASLLFSKRLREIPGVRLLLSGEPGTGKSAAAAYVATEVLGMASRDLRMTEVLFHRLGALERALASAFREAREQQAVLIIDEADSIAQDRGNASSNAVHLVTAMTNSLVLELDRHNMPVIFASNFADRLDAAIRRRIDLAFEVKPIPEDREAIAFRLLLDVDLPTSAGMGDTVIADYVSARRVLKLQGGGAEAAMRAVVRARDLRLGRYETKARKKIGF